MWQGRWPLLAVRVSCPGWWGRWTGMSGWCSWWGGRGWARPGSPGRAWPEGAVDPRVVVNRRQAEELLTAVSYQWRAGPQLVAFFACMYYAGTRPGETVELREDDNLDLPEHG